MKTQDGQSPELPQPQITDEGFAQVVGPLVELPQRGNNNSTLPSETEVVRMWREMPDDEKASQTAINSLGFGAARARLNPKSDAVKLGGQSEDIPMILRNTQFGTERVATPEEIEASFTPTPGVSVDVAERAKYLDWVLNDFAAINQRTGFQVAVNTPHRDGIEDRYGDATDRIALGSANTQERKLLEARRKFAKAFGLYAIRESGEMSDADLRAAAQASFESFSNEFFGIENAEARVAMRKKLKDQNEKLKVTGR